MYKWTFFVVFCLACCLGVGLLFNLPDKGEKTAEQQPTVSIPDKPQDVQAAADIYKSNCVSCHGDQMQGGVGPNLTKVGGTLSKTQIYNQIVKGGGVMPAFKGTLTDDQIVNLSSWLSTKK